MTSIDQIDTDQLIPMGGESMELGSLPSSKEFMNFTELPGDTSQSEFCVTLIRTDKINTMSFNSATYGSCHGW